MVVYLISCVTKTGDNLPYDFLQLYTIARIFTASEITRSSSIAEGPRDALCQLNFAAQLYEKIILKRLEVGELVYVTRTTFLDEK